MKSVSQVNEYKNKTTLELIEKYEGLIGETFEIFNKSVGQANTTKDGKEKELSEKEKLNKIQDRSAGLEQISNFLSKIEVLSGRLIEDNKGESSDGKTVVKKQDKEHYLHPTKQNAKSS